MDRHRLVDFSTSDFTNIEGGLHPTQQAVMPVVAYNGSTVRPVGTCFSVSSHGIVLTARHVIDEALNLGNWSPTEATHFSGQWWIGALYARPAEPNDDVPDAFGGIIPAHKVHLLPDLDIAAITLNLPLNTLTGERLRLPAHTLSPGLPDTGSMCFGLGYHTMEWSSSEATDVSYEVFHSYSGTRGLIEEVHFPYRDTRLLRFPCFRTSARFDGGMSGGPVIGMNGKVIGVICSSLGAHEDGGYISYASLIGPAFLLQLDAASEKGDHPAFLYDFVAGGSVSVDETMERLVITRDRDALRIDFGMPPVFQNIIGT